MQAAERMLRLLKINEDRAKRRLEELEGFLAEYREQLVQTETGGMPVYLMRDYHAFLAKIEQAIRLQTEAVQEAHRRWETAHKHWLAERQKVKAYEVLVEKARLEQVLRLARDEQHLTDELAKLAENQYDAHE